ncbi:HU family DNA-binding protein [Streptacidiphilus sp. PB12-B1b]|uniref:HU family DNA-binding protein n=1 Tax=Streptacidiphilus sp. PB12-B1b TaxID=2705012 RepID=UPI0015FA47A0|nr:HU family DNA-binding protein [Streptacidiphilus sp. PB12-B1b]QMU78952.1 HU family DNA-binding protein [Streptacidiphilus sp. PB12-B1b]
MNKAQLVEAVAEQLGGRRAAAEAVDAVLDTIVRAVTAGERVSVTGFGTFEKVDRSARFARNPQTGERVKVKKTAVPRFRPGQGFKDLVSGSKKLPKTGPSVKKAPKGSLTPGKSGMVAPAGSPAAKKAAAAAKKVTAKKSTPTVKKAAAKKTSAAAKKAAPAVKATTAAPAAKKTTAKKTSAAVKAPAKKTVTASAARPATKTAVTGAAKTAAAKKTTATAAKKTTAKKAPAKRAAKSS